MRPSAKLAGLVLLVFPWELPAEDPQSAIQSRLDFLRALNLAQEGSKPEALRLLAESLRLRPEGNPASALVFELLTELRTNSRLLLRGHKDAILYAAYSSDGAKIVTASADHTARIWDAHTGRQLTSPLQHDDDVLMAEFSPDGALVVTGSEDHTARVWDARTGRPIGVPMQARDAIRYVKFSPDGRLIASYRRGWRRGANLGCRNRSACFAAHPLSRDHLFHQL
jgi:hypothetical protein